MNEISQTDLALLKCIVELFPNATDIVELTFPVEASQVSQEWWNRFDTLLSRSYDEAGVGDTLNFQIEGNVVKLEVHRDETLTDISRMNDFVGMGMWPSLLPPTKIGYSKQRIVIGVETSFGPPEDRIWCTAFSFDSDGEAFPFTQEDLDKVLQKRRNVGQTYDEGTVGDIDKFLKL